MLNTKQYVENLLAEYNDRKNQLKVLEYELERMTRPMHPGVIEDIVLAHPNLGDGARSGVSDITGNMVIDHVDRQRGSQYYAILAIAHSLKLEIERLEYYLSLLPPQEKEIVTMIYLEGLNGHKLEEICKISRATVTRRKTRGLEKLAKFYGVHMEISSSHVEDFGRIHFVGYVHQERFMDTIKRFGRKEVSYAEKAVVYLLTGCAELWNTGIDNLYDFENSLMLKGRPEDVVWTDRGEKMWRLTQMISHELGRYDILYVIRSAITGLEYLHLELAIEALQIALKFST